MITIIERVIAQKPGRLEPHYVRYQHVRTPHIQRFEPVRAHLPKPKPLHPQVAGLYGTNRNPRDRMRHDYRWRERKARIARYTAIDPRWR